MKNKGISIYIALVIMAVLLNIALGISAILFGQIKMTREIGYSVIAFSAANTGIDRAIYEGTPPGNTIVGYLDLNDNGVQDEEDSSYRVDVISAGTANCPSPPAVHSCIKSVGVFKKTRRAIEATR